MYTHFSSVFYTVFMAFLKVNLFLVKVDTIRALEIRTLWLPANRGKYESVPWSIFLCQYSWILFKVTIDTWNLVGFTDLFYNSSIQGIHREWLCPKAPLFLLLFPPRGFGEGTSYSIHSHDWRELRSWKLVMMTVLWSKHMTQQESLRGIMVVGVC